MLIAAWLMTTWPGHDEKTSKDSKAIQTSTSFLWPSASGTPREVREAGLQSRRSLLGGLLMGLSNGMPEPAAARIVTIGLPCACCQKDWCATSCIDQRDGEETVCNCHDFLGDMQSSEQLLPSGGLYKLPREASKARLDAVAAGLGEERWAEKLDWKEARLLKWHVEDGSHLKVKPSTIDNAGDGLFTTVPLEKYTVLPPYQGHALSLAEFRQMRGTKEMDYVWCPLREASLFNFTDDQLMAAEKAGAATTFCIDGRGKADENPTRFINAARSKEQCKKVNVKICEFGDVAYFRTTADIKKGAELITDYGSEYWEDFEGC